MPRQSARSDGAAVDFCPRLRSRYLDVVGVLDVHPVTGAAVKNH